MPFEIEETSSIKAEGPNYYKEHRQLSDAMQHAINWLATKPINTKVTITEKTEVTRKT
jgi:hypothetical protein